MAAVIFSPLFSGERECEAVERRTLLLLCETAGNGAKPAIIHFSCVNQEWRNNQGANLSSAHLCRMAMFNLAKYTHT